MSKWVLPGLLAVFGAATSLAPAPASAQDASAEVVTVVESLFDAMRMRDTVAVRSFFDPAARLVNAGRGGNIQVQTVDQFVRTIGMADPNVALIEQIYEPQVMIDGNMATLWTYYSFHRGDQFSHCGYDSFQLFRSDAGWKIIHIADTRRTEGCRESGG